MENNAVRLKWSSRVDFVVALLGYSIGMPEFWRVPYLTYRNGGGPFIIAYILLMLVCGFPLYFLELALSQYSGKGPWRFWDICPLLRGIGIAIAVMNCVYSIALAIVIAWTVDYLVNSFKAVLPWTNCDNEWNTPACFRDSVNVNLSMHNSSFGYAPYKNVTTMNTELVLNRTLVQSVDSVDEFWLYRILNISQGIHVLGAVSAVLLAYMLMTRLLSSLSIVKSVASLGKVSYITALLPVALILVIWVRALTLPGATKGMLYFVSADFRRFADPQLWIEASFQTFLTLGPGWGGLMMVGAHNKFRTNSFQASIISTSATLTFGLVNGLVVFSVLGVMSEEIGISIGEVMTSGGFSIAFIAYPKALSYFPFPQVWCVIFYIVILLPGLDGMAILTEPFLLILEEMFPKQLNNRRISLLAVVSVVMFLFSIPFATQAGVYMFMLVDWYVGTWSAMLICMAECIVFAWIYGAHRIDRDIRLMFDRPLPVIIRISTAFVMPIFLTCLLLISIFTYKPPSFGEYNYPLYARAIGWCFTLSSLLPALSYCVWLIVNEKGTFRQRFTRLAKHTKEWAPANEKAEEIYRETEHLAEFTWRQLFWFNVTGRGGIVMKGIKADSVPML